MVDWRGSTVEPRARGALSVPHGHPGAVQAARGQGEATGRGQAGGEGSSTLPRAWLGPAPAEPGLTTRWRVASGPPESGAGDPARPRLPLLFLPLLLRGAMFAGCCVSLNEGAGQAGLLRTRPNQCLSRAASLAIHHRPKSCFRTKRESLLTPAVMCLSRLLDVFQEQRERLKHHCSQGTYLDLPARCARYMLQGCLPSEFEDPDRWPTGSPGAAWSTEAVFDLFAQVLGSPLLGRAAFSPGNIVRRCMMARRVRRGAR